MPWVFTAAVVAVTWQLILLPQGILNSVLSRIVHQRILINWLGQPFTAMVTLIVVNAWRGYPFCMTSFLAGLQNIPENLYEAARIDGANTRQLFFRITIPQLKPIILSVVLLDSIWTLNLFPLIWLLTGGGPPLYDRYDRYVYLPIRVYGVSIRSGLRGRDGRSRGYARVHRVLYKRAEGSIA